MRRHELTDEQWDKIKDLFQDNGGRGEQWRDHRTLLNGVFWRLREPRPLPGKKTGQVQLIDSSGRC